MRRQILLGWLAGTAQHSTAQHSTAQHSTAQHSTAQHSTAQHSTAQHSTAQHSTAQQIHITATLASNPVSTYCIACQKVRLGSIGQANPVEHKKLSTGWLTVSWKYTIPQLQWLSFRPPCKPHPPGVWMPVAPWCGKLHKPVCILRSPYECCSVEITWHNEVQTKTQLRLAKIETMPVSDHHCSPVHAMAPCDSLQGLVVALAIACPSPSPLWQVCYGIQ